MAHEQSFEVQRIPKPYSEEFSDVLGQTPKSVVRGGIIIMIILSVLIIAIAYTVNYADLVHAIATVKPRNNPKTVVAKLDSKITKLFEVDNSFVEKGTILGYIESTAIQDEILNLEAAVDSVMYQISIGNWDAIHRFDAGNFRHLGELQLAYQSFMQSLIQVSPYLENGASIAKRRLIINDLNYSKAMQHRLEVQLSVFEREFVLAQEYFKVQEQLYKEKVLPLLQYKEEESKLLSKQIPSENMRTALITNAVTTLGKEQELLQLTQAVKDQKDKFMEALNALSSEIRKWKQQYLLIAPDSGIVTSPIKLIENQDIHTGQELFYVTQPNSYYYVELWLEQEKFGKVQIGQKVLIKLVGYPSQEFGCLVGHLDYISDISNGKNQYQGIVTLDNGLITDYNRRIPFSNQMVANAEIVTQKTKLINKFLSTLRGVLYKRH